MAAPPPPPSFAPIVVPPSTFFADMNKMPHGPVTFVTTWIIWDVRDACGQSRWCGVKPLADELDASEDNMGQPTCQIHPCSRTLPGGPCVWKHSFNDGIRQGVHFASGRTSGWEVSMSVIGPEFYETEISAFRFFPGDLLESIGLATLTGSNLWGETEAEGSDGAPVPGVKRYRAEGKVLHRPERRGRGRGPGRFRRRRAGRIPVVGRDRVGRPSAATSSRRQGRGRRSSSSSSFLHRCSPTSSFLLLIGCGRVSLHGPERDEAPKSRLSPVPPAGGFAAEGA